MRKLVATEAEIQAGIVEFLRLAGCTVLQTSKRGQANSRGGYTTLADKSVPDLLVSHSSWPYGMALMMEVKRPGGEWSSPEQKALWEAGRTCRVESVEDAAMAVQGKFHGLGLTVPPLLQQAYRPAYPQRFTRIWGRM